MRGPQSTRTWLGKADVEKAVLRAASCNVWGRSGVRRLPVKCGVCRLVPSGLFGCPARPCSGCEALGCAGLSPAAQGVGQTPRCSMRRLWGGQSSFSQAKATPAGEQSGLKWYGRRTGGIPELRFEGGGPFPRRGGGCTQLAVRAAPACFPGCCAHCSWRWWRV